MDASSYYDMFFWASLAFAALLGFGRGVQE